MLEQRVNELKQIIAGNDGHNAADARFSRAVDELVSAVYDNIGEIKDLPTRTLFDLFVIKVLYVGRHSRHADVVDYLGRLLDTYVAARELTPPDADGKPRTMYFSDMLDEQKIGAFQNRFEAYRKYADSALFLTGVFPSSLQPRRPSSRTHMRRHAARTVDAAYYVTTGKAMYHMASREDLAEDTNQRDTLAKLAQYFEVYADALTEMSERYIMGFDMELIADKMLDNINRYRESRDERYLTNARRYAAILSIDRLRFPALFEEQD
ncbi:MAG: hypothetical protein M3P30_07765 [Chloroflexota bacterium]|nr:hypothetical protein [Chloroflexota bacterium]